MTITPAIWKSAYSLNDDDGFQGPEDVSPKIAALDDGGFVVAWLRDGTAAYRLFDARGEARGDVKQVPGGLIGNSLDVGTPGGGGFSMLLTGRDAGANATSRARVLAFDGDGNLVATRSETALPYEASLPAFRFDHASFADRLGYHSLTYHIIVGEPTTRVSVGTIGIGGEVTDTPISPIGVEQSHGDIAVLADGSFRVASQQLTQAAANFTGQQDVVLTRSRQSAELVAQGSGNQLDPSAAGLTGPDGGVVVVYQSTVGQIDGGDGSGPGLFLKVYENDGSVRLRDAAGVPPGADANATGPVNLSTAGVQRSPEAAMLPDGGFVVFWDDDNFNGAIVGQRFDGEGLPVGGEFRLSTNRLVDAPAATMLFDGRVAVAWQRQFGDSDPVAAIIDPRVGPVNGGNGDDVLTRSPQSLTVTGDRGDDTLWGSDAFDALFGNADDDLIFGGGGGDLAYGGGGDDRLHGDDGDDRIEGGGGADRGWGGAGIDWLIGAGGKDVLKGGADDDQLQGGGRNDRLFGQKGRDDVAGDAGADALFGGGQGDLLSGGRGRDRLDGGGGRDRLDGGGGRDRLDGGGGRDRLDGGGGRDRLDGGGGDDVLTLGGGRDVVALSGGRDRVTDFRRPDALDLGRGESFDDLRFRARGDDLLIIHDDGRLVLEDVSLRQATEGFLL